MKGGGDVCQGKAVGKLPPRVKAEVQNLVAQFQGILKVRCRRRAGRESWLCCTCGVTAEVWRDDLDTHRAHRAAVPVSCWCCASKEVQEWCETDWDLGWLLHIGWRPLRWCMSAFSEPYTSC